MLREQGYAFLRWLRFLSSWRTFYSSCLLALQDLAFPASRSTQPVFLLCFFILLVILAILCVLFLLQRQRTLCISFRTFTLSCIDSLPSPDLSRNRFSSASGTLREPCVSSLLHAQLRFCLLTSDASLSPEALASLFFLIYTHRFSHVLRQLVLFVRALPWSPSYVHGTVFTVDGLHCFSRLLFFSSSLLAETFFSFGFPLYIAGCFMRFYCYVLSSQEK